MAATQSAVRGPSAEARTRVVLNGKFLIAPPTGVHRVAEELVRALDQLLAEDARLAERLDLEVAVPAGTLRSLALDRIEVNRVGSLRKRLWEQISLPRYTGDARLLNFCNLAPLARPDVVMIHDAQVHISPGSYSWAFATYYKLVQPLMARRASRVLTVSNFSRDMLVKFGVATAQQVSVVYNGVDHMLQVAADETALQRLGLEKGRYVVALANGQRHKNVGLLLRAFDCPSLASFKLVLVGPATAAEFRASGFPVPDSVIFAGRVSDEALRAMLESALCLAFPSLTEGFGLPPMEAMIIGCPAVVAPCGALPEVCGDAAIYADPNDPAAWRDVILGLAADERRRGEASEAGRARASGFTWRRSAQQLLDVLEL